MNWTIYHTVFKKLLYVERKLELIALATLAVGILFSSLLHIWVSYLSEVTQVSPMISYLKEYDFSYGMIRGVFLVSTIIVFSLFLLTRLLYNTRFGLVARSLFEDKTLAEIQGINTSNVYSFLWFLSGGLAGSLYPFILVTSPREAFLFQNSIMASCILGGFGNVIGGFFGATVFGFIEVMVTILGQQFFGAWFGEYRFFISIAIIALLLRYYPKGLKKQSMRNRKNTSLM